MTNQLPAPVQAYFAAATPAAIADCFTPDATVTDERRTHRGRAEILAWREGVAAIDFRQDILSATRDGPRVAVTCRVSGAFKGSPVELDYAFELSGERISRLTIR